MKQENLSKKELEKKCVQEGIILERHDPINNTTFYLPNLEKISIMIREFDFLVDGASRGKAINQISQIERFMHKHENEPALQNEILATSYSDASIYLEEKKDLITDKNSENWSFIFTKYFTLEDIYNYFHKSESTSTYFRKFRIFSEMVEINYYIKLMEYLQSQIELFIPLDDDKEIPFKVDSLEFSIFLLHKLGLLDTLKERMKENYYINGSKLLTTLLGRPTSNWKSINDMMWDIDHNPDESILENDQLKDKLREVLFHFKIDLR